MWHIVPIRSTWLLEPTLAPAFYLAVIPLSLTPLDLLHGKWVGQTKSKVHILKTLPSSYLHVQCWRWNSGNYSGTPLQSCMTCPTWSCSDPVLFVYIDMLGIAGVEYLISRRNQSRTLPKYVITSSSVVWKKAKKKKKKETAAPPAIRSPHIAY